MDKNTNANTSGSGSANVPNDVDASKISLSPLTKYEVANKSPSYRQYIHYNGAKLMLMTPTFEAEQLTLRKSGDDVSVLLPIGAWMRRQFDIVEKYVQQNVTLPATESEQTALLFYKPLWQQDKMCFSIARGCNVFRRNAKINTYEGVKFEDVQFGPGKYTVTVELPHIYIGPHRGGETFSLSTRFAQIVYDPKITPEISTVLETEKSPNIPFKTSETKVKGNGRKKSKALTARITLQ